MAELVDDQVDLPSVSDIKELLALAVNKYTGKDSRNEMIKTVRDMIAGLNIITAPKSVQFKAVKAHSWLFYQALAEKKARFLETPRLQVAPFGDGVDAQADATGLEEGIRGMFYWLEQRDKGRPWSKAVPDVIALDNSVIRVDRAEAAFWSALVPEFNQKTKEYENVFSRVLQDEKEYAKLTEEYKKGAGVPLRLTYVPLEYFFPGEDGNYNFELERRSLNEVRKNKKFDCSGLPNAPSLAKSMETKVTIVHFDNANWHAYYALMPTGGSWKDEWPNAMTVSDLASGTPVLLYSYEHGLGESQYEVITGAHGGWGGENSNLVARLRAMCDINQQCDELLSQAMTNFRATSWPTTVMKIDQDRADAEDDERNLTIVEGGVIKIYKDESVGPYLEPKDNPLFESLMRHFGDIFQRISGGDTLYGVHTPGTNTGYQANLQLTQAEHLDNGIEAGLSLGFTGIILKCLKHIRKMNEKVYAVATQTQFSGKKTARYACIDPNKLGSLPVLDVAVQGERPTDYHSAIMDALALSQEREGKGPLADDYWIRANILAMDSPDKVERNIWVQKQKVSIMGNGFLDQQIAQKLAMALVQEGAPTTTDGQAASVDPALMAATSSINMSGEPAQMGGVAPQTLGAQMTGQFAAGQPLPAPVPYNGTGLPPAQQVGAAPPQMGGGVPYQAPMSAPPQGFANGTLVHYPSAIAGQGGGLPAGISQVPQVVARNQRVPYPTS